MNQWQQNQMRQQQERMRRQQEQMQHQQEQMMRRQQEQMRQQQEQLHRRQMQGHWFAQQQQKRQAMQREELSKQHGELPLNELLKKKPGLHKSLRPYDASLQDKPQAGLPTTSDLLHGTPEETKKKGCWATIAVLALGLLCLATAVSLLT